MLFISKGGTHTIISMLNSFNKFISTIDYNLVGFEQLWLAFVMKERYNKIWSTEKLDWVSI